MKIAVVGSRDITVADIGRYISDGEEIVSGGAVGVDSCAAEYARKNGIKLTVFLPQYERYGRAAPIVRNKEIVDYADKIIAFWNGSSKGTLSVIAEESRSHTVLCGKYQHLLQTKHLQYLILLRILSLLLHDICSLKTA